MMELPAALFNAIERTTVTHQDHHHHLRVLSVVPSPPPPLTAIGMEITVGVVHDGKEYRASCTFGLENAKEEEYVLESLAGAMKRVLSGDLPPGVIEFL